MTKKQTTTQGEGEKSFSAGAVAKVKKFREYLELSRTELRKVTWPTLKETKATSFVVLGFIVVMALFLGLVDLGLSKIVALILA